MTVWSAHTVWICETKKCTIKCLSAESVENCGEKQHALLHLPVQSVPGSHGWGLHPAGGVGSTSHSRNQHNLVWYPSGSPLLLHIL